MKINQIRWDDDRVEHIGERHGLTTKEVEEVCYGEHMVQRTRQGWYTVFGRTSSGRYLKVILFPLGRGAFKPITALPMTETEKRRFNRKGK